MICAQVKQNGSITSQAPLTNGTCENLVLVNQNEFEFSYAQITASEILTDFSWGFSVVILFWSFGYAVGVGKDMLKKL